MGWYFRLKQIIEFCIRVLSKFYSDLILIVNLVEMWVTIYVP